MVTGESERNGPERHHVQLISVWKTVRPTWKDADPAWSGITTGRQDDSGAQTPLDLLLAGSDLDNQLADRESTRRHLCARTLSLFTDLSTTMSDA